MVPGTERIHEQGGQTQGTNIPNIFPVDHVTSMLIDGKCINLVNIWRKHDINAADDMILVLKKVVPEEYTLSRASGNTQRFSNLPTNHPVDGQGPVNLEERRMDGVWQLVPWIYNRADEPEVASEYDYRDNGFVPPPLGLPKKTSLPLSVSCILCRSHGDVPLCISLSFSPRSFLLHTDMVMPGWLAKIPASFMPSWRGPFP